MLKEIVIKVITVSTGITSDSQSLVIDRHRRRVANQLLSVAGAELLLFVPKVRINGQFLNFRKGEIFLGQKVVDALSVVGRDVVHLCEVLFLRGC